MGERMARKGGNFVFVKSGRLGKVAPLIGKSSRQLETQTEVEKPSKKQLLAPQYSRKVEELNMLHDKQTQLRKELEDTELDSIETERIRKEIDKVGERANVLEKHIYGSQMGGKEQSMTEEEYEEAKEDLDGYEQEEKAIELILEDFRERRKKTNLKVGELSLRDDYEKRLKQIDLEHADLKDKIEKYEKD